MNSAGAIEADGPVSSSSQLVDYFISDGFRPSPSLGVVYPQISQQQQNVEIQTREKEGGALLFSSSITLLLMSLTTIDSYYPALLQLSASLMLPVDIGAPLSPGALDLTGALQREEGGRGKADTADG